MSELVRGIQSEDIETLSILISAKFDGKLDTLNKSIRNIESMSHVTKDQVNALAIGLEAQKDSLQSLKDDIKLLNESRNHDFILLSQKVEDCEKQLEERLEKDYTTVTEAKLDHQELKDNIKDVIYDKNKELRETIEKDFTKKLNLAKWLMGFFATVVATVMYVIQHWKP